MRRLLILISVLAAYQTLCAQVSQRVSVAFWNTENFYDTIPSLFYDDSEYTPDGVRKWGLERYGTKVRNIARVIDDMSADIVGLAEIESETAVRDLVMALGTDYNYIHRTSGDSRGMDIAMLYKGDKFFPANIRQIRSGTGREFLHVTGELMGESVDIIVCHMASNLNDYEYRRRNMAALRQNLERLFEEDPEMNIVVMGDMNAVPGEKVVRKTIGSISLESDFMYNPHWGEYHLGKGSYWYNNHWYLYDWMLVSPSIALGKNLQLDRSGIYVKEYMTGRSGSDQSSAYKPFRTFYGREYLGGYSDHFPVYMYIGK